MKSRHLETHLVVFQPLQLKADLTSISASSDQDVDKFPIHHTGFLLKSGGGKKKRKGKTVIKKKKRRQLPVNLQP